MATRSSRRAKSAQKQRKAVVEVPQCIEIPPLAHLHFRGDRHLHPQRLPSAKREVPVSLRLLDTLPHTVANVCTIGQFLKRLTMSGIRLTAIPLELLDGLTSLEKLDLSQNRLHDASIPEDCKGMDNLLELILNNNKMARVPPCLKKMKNLSRLDLSHNKLDSLKGLEKLKRLQVLIVENNLLVSVFKDVGHLRKLETFCCSYNNIRDVPSDIRHMRTLKVINLSYNKISSLLPEIFLLPRLEVLDVSNNTIAKVQSFTVKLMSRHWIQHVDLSENTIVRFPEHLLLIVKKLDLSGNKIKLLISNVLKKMDWKSEQELILENNPMTYPSAEICNSGLKTIIQFIQEVKAESVVHQGLKAIAMGSQGSGKSSLVQSLVDQQPRLEEGGQLSCGIECYDTGLSSSTDDESDALNLCLWDFGGHPSYLYPHIYFVEHPSVAIVTFNMAEFSTKGFDELIGNWLNWIISRNNKLVAIVVGTQSDKLSSEQVDKVTLQVERAIAKYIKVRKSQFEFEMKKIESRPHITATYSELLKNYMNLLQATLEVHPKVVVTSSAEYVGFDKLLDAIKSVAQDSELFPNFKRQIPTFWVDVEHFLEDKGNFMAIPVMTWADYEEVVTKKFGLKHVLTSITQYLHETGKVVWFSKINSLKNHVFLRPSWLFEVFRYVFRYDIGTEAGCPMEWLKKIGLSAIRIDKAWKEVVEEGIVEKDFLKGLLGGCVPHDLNQPFLQVLTLLVEGFGIGYPVQSKLKKGAYRFSLDPEPDGKVKIERVLLPWYRKNPEPVLISELWNSLAKSPKVVAEYNFHQYMPAGIFEMYAVRLNSMSTTQKLQILAHWGGGFHVHHQVEAIQVLVLYKTDTQGNSIMVFDIRGAEKEQPATTKTLWEVLLPMLMLFEELLQSFSGCWMSRYVRCPHCQVPSFIGEWLTPKETQGFSVRPCRNCEKHVDTGYLVPPKEKKRDDIRNRVSRIRSGRRQSSLKGLPEESLDQDKTKITLATTETKKSQDVSTTTNTV